MAVRRSLAAALAFLARCLMALALLLGSGMLRAQGIESVLSPGRLIQGHAKWENECAKCHIRFDR